MEQERKYEAPGYITYREAALMFSLMPEADAAKTIAIENAVDHKKLYRNLEE